MLFAIIAPGNNLRLDHFLQLYLSLLEELPSRYQVNNAGPQKLQHLQPITPRLPTGFPLPGNRLDRVPGKHNNPLI